VAARRSCWDSNEANSRARGNTEGPIDAAPGVRLNDDLKDQGATTSAGNHSPIFSPEWAAWKGDKD